MRRFAFFNLHFALAVLAHAIVPQLAWADAPLVVPTDGESFRAELSAVDADWHVTFRTGQRQRTVPAADLLCWGQCPEQGRGGALVLADGSLVAAEVVAADRKTLTADSDVFGTLKLPLESLSGIVFHQSSSRADRDKLLDRLARAAGQSDRLLLDNGDELSGLVASIADDTVKLQTDAGPVDVKTERVTALVFNPTLKRKPAAKGTPLQVWVGLSDGSRLLATQLLVQGDSVSITAVGQPLAASQRDLVFLQPLGGRAVYLSDLKPAEYRQTPYLDLPWPYQADRNVTGGLLRCGGRLYLKGLGVHSAARLVYTLDQLYKRFDAELGIDDSTGGQGSVQFHVLVDGQEKFTSPILRGGNPPMPVSVDVTGAKKLELVVDYADRADVLDHADWLNARLTK